MTRDQIKQANNLDSCNRCVKFGHWLSDHLQNRSLPDGVMSSLTPIKDDDKSNNGGANDGQSKQDSNANNTIGFKNGSTAHHINNDKVNALKIGPLVDSGAPYSAVGAVELALPSCYALPNRNRPLDDVPKTLSDYHYWKYGTGNDASAQR